MDRWLCWFKLLLQPFLFEGSDELKADGVGEDLDHFREGVASWEDDIVTNVGSFLYPGSLSGSVVSYAIIAKWPRVRHSGVPRS